MSASFFTDPAAAARFFGYLDRLRGSPLFPSPTWSYGYDEGRDYIKVWRRFGAQDSRSIVAFVDRRGTLYKANSWKKRGRMIGAIS